MKALKSIIFFAFLLLGTYGYSQVDMISAEDFKTVMKENADLVIIDGSKSKLFKTSHLKGSLNLNHNDLYRDGDVKGVIKSPEELAEIFGGLGVGDNRMVVITDDGSQKYSSRIYWVLKYLGYENMKVLHKDKNAWKKVRLELTRKSSTPNPTTFTVNLNPEIFASIDEVKKVKNDNKVVLIDVRTPEEFSGSASNSKGHIPGAININYEDLLTENGAFKTADELQMIAAKNGLTPDKELIFYCRTSVRAGVSFFAFTNILNYPNVKVYDGAYLEWSSVKDVVQ